MIKEALEFLAKLQTPKNPQMVEVHGQPYGVKVDGTLGEYIEKPNPHFYKPTLEVTTLSALVAAYKAGLDGLDTEKVAVQVVDPFTVYVIDLKADDFGERHMYIEAKHAKETAFEFNKYMDPEPFLLNFRAGFYFNENAVKVVHLCSTVGAGDAVAVSDDGVSQEVVTKSGTITRAAVTLPADGVPLIPWRTFRDANPVESRFLLRMRGVKDALPQMALFEIDAKWKLDTVNSIRSYLAGELAGATIIA